MSGALRRFTLSATLVTAACTDGSAAFHGSSDGGDPAVAVGAGGSDATDAGSGGSSSIPGAGGARHTGGASAGGASSACVPALALCDGDGDVCCPGSLCVDRDGAKRCVQTCAMGTDCGSLCCADDVATGKKLCAAETECPPLACSGVAGPCTQPGPTCCEGLTCVASKAKEYSGCRKPCTVATECDSGCCVPYANAKSGFCAEAAACACAVLDGSCGGVHHCCDGLSCTTFDDTGAFACKPTCHADADCQSGCCRPIEGTTESACLSSEWCGP